MGWSLEALHTVQEVLSRPLPHGSLAVFDSKTWKIFGRRAQFPYKQPQVGSTVSFKVQAIEPFLLRLMNPALPLRTEQTLEIARSKLQRGLIIRTKVMSDREQVSECGPTGLPWIRTKVMSDKQRTGKGVWSHWTPMNSIFPRTALTFKSPAVCWKFHLSVKSKRWTYAIWGGSSLELHLFEGWGVSLFIKLAGIS